MQDGDDDYYNAVDDEQRSADLGAGGDGTAGWPDTLPQIKLPNAWPNIYQNKSRRQPVENSGGKSSSSSFKGEYLLWQQDKTADGNDEDDGNFVVADDNGVDNHNNLHKNADQSDDVAKANGYTNNMNKVAVYNANNGVDAAEAAAVGGVEISGIPMEKRIFSAKSFNEKSRNHARLEDEKCIIA